MACWQDWTDHWRSSLVVRGVGACPQHLQGPLAETGQVADPEGCSQWPWADPEGCYQPEMLRESLQSLYSRHEGGLQQPWQQPPCPEVSWRQYQPELVAVTRQAAVSDSLSHCLSWALTQLQIQRE